MTNAQYLYADVAPLDGASLAQRLAQHVQVDCVPIMQRAIRIRAPQIMHNVELYPVHYSRGSQNRAIQVLRAPLRFLSEKGRTIVTRQGQQYPVQDEVLPRLRAPRINEQWINEIDNADYSRGF